MWGFCQLIGAVWAQSIARILVQLEPPYDLTPCPLNSLACVRCFSLDKDLLAVPGVAVLDLPPVWCNPGVGDGVDTDTCLSFPLPTFTVRVDRYIVTGAEALGKLFKPSIGPGAYLFPGETAASFGSFSLCEPITCSSGPQCGCASEFDCQCSGITSPVPLAELVSRNDAAFFAANVGACRNFECIHACHPSAECAVDLGSVNAGSARCICRAGFVGDGATHCLPLPLTPFSDAVQRKGSLVRSLQLSPSTVRSRVEHLRDSANLWRWHLVEFEDQLSNLGFPPTNDILDRARPFTEFASGGTTPARELRGGAGVSRLPSLFHCRSEGATSITLCGTKCDVRLKSLRFFTPIPGFEPFGQVLFPLLADISTPGATRNLTCPLTTEGTAVLELTLTDRCSYLVSSANEALDIAGAELPGSTLWTLPENTPSEQQLGVDMRDQRTLHVDFAGSAEDCQLVFAAIRPPIACKSPWGLAPQGPLCALPASVSVSCGLFPLKCDLGDGVAYTCRTPLESSYWLDAVCAGLAESEVLALMEADNNTAGCAALQADCLANDAMLPLWNVDTPRFRCRPPYTTATFCDPPSGDFSLLFCRGQEVRCYNDWCVSRPGLFGANSRSLFLDCQLGTPPPPGYWDLAKTVHQALSPEIREDFNPLLPYLALFNTTQSSLSARIVILNGLSPGFSSSALGQQLLSIATSPGDEQERWEAGLVWLEAALQTSLCESVLADCGGDPLKMGCVSETSENAYLAGGAPESSGVDVSNFCASGVDALTCGVDAQGRPWVPESLPETVFVRGCAHFRLLDQFGSLQRAVWFHEIKCSVVEAASGTRRKCLYWCRSHSPGMQFEIGEFPAALLLGAIPTPNLATRPNGQEQLCNEMRAFVLNPTAAAQAWGVATSRSHLSCSAAGLPPSSASLLRGSGVGQVTRQQRLLGVSEQSSSASTLANSGLCLYEIRGRVAAAGLADNRTAVCGDASMTQSGAAACVLSTAGLRCDTDSPEDALIDGVAPSCLARRVGQTCAGDASSMYCAASSAPGCPAALGDSTSRLCRPALPLSTFNFAGSVVVWQCGADANGSPWDVTCEATSDTAANCSLFAQDVVQLACSGLDAWTVFARFGLLENLGPDLDRARCLWLKQTCLQGVVDAALGRQGDGVDALFECACPARGACSGTELANQVLAGNAWQTAAEHHSYTGLCALEHFCEAVPPPVTAAAQPQRQIVCGESPPHTIDCTQESSQLGDWRIACKEANFQEIIIDCRLHISPQELSNFSDSRLCDLIVETCALGSQHVPRVDQLTPDGCSVHRHPLAVVPPSTDLGWWEPNFSPQCLNPLAATCRGFLCQTNHTCSPPKDALLCGAAAFPVRCLPDGRFGNDTLGQPLFRLCTADSSAGASDRELTMRCKVPREAFDSDSNSVRCLWIAQACRDDMRLARDPPSAPRSAGAVCRLAQDPSNRTACLATLPTTDGERVGMITVGPEGGCFSSTPNDPFGERREWDLLPGESGWQFQCGETQVLCDWADDDCTTVYCYSNCTTQRLCAVSHSLIIGKNLDTLHFGNPSPPRLLEQWLQLESSALAPFLDPPAFEDWGCVLPTQQLLSPQGRCAAISDQCQTTCPDDKVIDGLDCLEKLNPTSLFTCSAELPQAISCRPAEGPNPKSNPEASLVGVLGEEWGSAQDAATLPLSDVAEDDPWLFCENANETATGGGGTWYAATQRLERLACFVPRKALLTAPCDALAFWCTVRRTGLIRCKEGFLFRYPNFCTDPDPSAPTAEEAEGSECNCDVHWTPGIHSPLFGTPLSLIDTQCYDATASAAIRENAGQCSTPQTLNQELDLALLSTAPEMSESLAPSRTGVPPTRTPLREGGRLLGPAQAEAALTEAYGRNWSLQLEHGISCRRLGLVSPHDFFLVWLRALFPSIVQRQLLLSRYLNNDDSPITTLGNSLRGLGAVVPKRDLDLLFRNDSTPDPRKAFWCLNAFVPENYWGFDSGNSPQVAPIPAALNPGSESLVVPECAVRGGVGLPLCPFVCPRGLFKHSGFASLLASLEHGPQPLLFAREAALSAAPGARNAALSCCASPEQCSEEDCVLGVSPGVELLLFDESQVGLANLDAETLLNVRRADVGSLAWWDWDHASLVALASQLAAQTGFALPTRECPRAHDLETTAHPDADFAFSNRLSCYEDPDCVGLVRVVESSLAADTGNTVVKLTRPAIAPREALNAIDPRRTHSLSTEQRYRAHQVPEQLLFREGQLLVPVPARLATWSAEASLIDRFVNQAGGAGCQKMEWTWTFGLLGGPGAPIQTKEDRKCARAASFVIDRSNDPDISGKWGANVLGALIQELCRPVSFTRSFSTLNSVCWIPFSNGPKCASCGAPGCEPAFRDFLNVDIEREVLRNTLMQTEDASPGAVSLLLGARQETALAVALRKVAPWLVSRDGCVLPRTRARMELLSASGLIPSADGTPVCLENVEIDSADVANNAAGAPWDVSERWRQRRRFRAWLPSALRDGENGGRAQWLRTFLPVFGSVGSDVEGAVRTPRYNYLGDTPPTSERVLLRRLPATDTTDTAADLVGWHQLRPHRNGLLSDSDILAIESVLNSGPRLSYPYPSSVVGTQSLWQVLALLETHSWVAVGHMSSGLRREGLSEHCQSLDKPLWADARCAEPLCPLPLSPDYSFASSQGVTFPDPDSVDLWEDEGIPCDSDHGVCDNNVCLCTSDFSFSTSMVRQIDEDALGRRTAPRSLRADACEYDVRNGCTGAEIGQRRVCGGTGPTGQPQGECVLDLVSGRQTPQCDCGRYAEPDSDLFCNEVAEFEYGSCIQDPLAEWFLSGKVTAPSLAESCTEPISACRSEGGYARPDRTYFDRGWSFGCEQPPFEALRSRATGRCLVDASVPAGTLLSSAQGAAVTPGRCDCFQGWYGALCQYPTLQNRCFDLAQTNFTTVQQGGAGNTPVGSGQALGSVQTFVWNFYLAQWEPRASSNIAQTSIDSSPALYPQTIGGGRACSGHGRCVHASMDDHAFERGRAAIPGFEYPTGGFPANWPLADLLHNATMFQIFAEQHCECEGQWAGRFCEIQTCVPACNQQTSRCRVGPAGVPPVCQCPVLPSGLCLRALGSDCVCPSGTQVRTCSVAQMGPIAPPNRGNPLVNAVESVYGEPDVADCLCSCDQIRGADSAADGSPACVPGPCQPGEQVLLQRKLPCPPGIATGAQECCAAPNCVNLTLAAQEPPGSFCTATSCLP